ncbi:MAG: nucleotidyl transferase AbiEii/AbiGii toxin family protein [Halanaeroarchaeum sp.]
MLSRAELEGYARTLTQGNVGQAETLYLQDIVLLSLSRETADEVVFKGGTALLKFYQLDRFSEDLDFSAHRPVEFSDIVDIAVRALETYGASVAERSTDETDQAFHTRLGIEGPLYTGERRSLSFLRLEINKGSTVSRIRTPRYTPQFSDIPTFDLAVLDEAEILAEKLRALVTRREPRDLYDIYHLLHTSVDIDPALVQEKLEYYERTFDPDRMLESAEALESSWGTLGPLVYSDLPPFEDVLGDLERALAELD